MDTSERLATRGAYATHSRLSMSSHDVRFLHNSAHEPQIVVCSTPAPYTPGSMLGSLAKTPFGAAHGHLSPVEPVRGTYASQDVVPV